MCTTIHDKQSMAGSAKGPRGWFEFDQVCVGYDHPTRIDLDHALTVDFVDDAGDPGARVAVELGRASARALAEQILRCLDEADAYERA
jgi:hypothetical protein